MKKDAFLMVVFVACVAFAQGNGQNGDYENRGMGGMGKSKMDSTMECKMMEMHMFGPKTAIATTDGGIVIIMGNKLLKYDKDLNLKKEAEIKIDSTAMKRMMRNCPKRSDSNSADTTVK